MMSRLKAVPLFEECPEEFLEVLVKSLEPEVYLDGDAIVRAIRASFAAVMGRALCVARILLLIIDIDFGR